MCFECRAEMFGLEPGCWKVEAIPVGDAIRVYASWGGTTIKHGATYIYEPTWLELKLGITLEKKLSWARETQEKVCNRENKKLLAEIRNCRMLRGE